jgi:zinc transport system substrate-binding protein
MMIIDIAVTHPVLHSLVKILGGDYVEAMNIIPPDMDPHEYEPPTDTIKRIGASDLILIDALNHLPISDKIYNLYPDKSIVLYNELRARGWTPDKIPGTGIDNLHEFLLDEKALLMTIDTVGETLAGIAGKKGYSEAQQLIKANIEITKKIFSEAYNNARSLTKLSGISEVVLYSPVPYYLVKSLGIEVSAIMTPDPEVEPSPQSLQKLSSVSAKCLLISSDAEHIEIARIEASLKPLGIRLVDLKLFSYKEPWSLPFLPLLAANLIINRCISEARSSSEATSYSDNPSMSLELAAGIIAGIMIGVVAMTIVTRYGGVKRWKR